MLYVNAWNKITELKRIRNLIGIEIADSALISQSFLSDIDRDKTKPSLDTLFTICNMYWLSLYINEHYLPKTDTKTLVDLINKLLVNIKRLYNVSQ